MKYKIGECKKCKNEGQIVNSHFRLCRKCNDDRLSEKRPEKSKSFIKSKKVQIKRNKPLKSSGYIKVPEDRLKVKIGQDNDVYRQVFNSRSCDCEECGKNLNEEFEDEEGNVIARHTYSHIVPKSIAPELRHNINNFNRLCLECHVRWENGDKENMRIFLKNVKLFPEYLEKWKT